MPAIAGRVRWWRRVSLRQQMVYGFAVPVLVVLLASLYVAMALESMRDAARESIASSQATNLRYALLNLVVDAETGLRGYLLTSDPEFLEPFDTGSKLEGISRQLDVSEKAEPEHLRKLREVQALFKRWRSDFAEPLIRLRHDAPIGIEEDDRGGAVLVPGGAPLPTLRILPQGISRKRLEQAIRDLQLPVVIAREVDEADVVMTLRNEYKQKTPLLREAEERALPIYVLKSNTVPQMQSSLTSIFSLEIDPREAALREAEDAIEAVLQSSEAVELSPQNAYIRRLQHQRAEAANLTTRSRGREPFRRVRVYPDPVRNWR